MVAHMFKKPSRKRDFAEADLHAASWGSNCPVSFDAYVPASGTPSSITGAPGVWVSTGAGANALIDPYQLAVRKSVEKFLSRADGNFFSYGGVTYQAYTFMVPLTEICEQFRQIRYLPMVLG